MSETPEGIKSYIPKNIATFTAVRFENGNADAVKWLAEQNDLSHVKTTVATVRNRPVVTLRFRTKRGKGIEVREGMYLVAGHTSVRAMSARDFNSFYKEA